jgi:glycerol-3-phosphate dehydrogenase
MEAFMQRDFSALSKNHVDLAILGGGATGAAIALDASLRGLRVALIDKRDFSGATSAGSSKLMHGGLRYLANGDIAQVREGLRERRHWSRMAKHLVHPLAFLIPTYETSQPRRAILKLGLYLYDLLAFDRNRAVDPMQKMAGHRSVTAAQVLGLSPDTPRVGPQGTLTGGLMYQDGQMLSPERLVLAMLRTAAQAGALVVNHCEATGFVQSGSSIGGVKIKDCLTQETGELSAELVINAAGPWADEMMKLGDGEKLTKKLVRSKGIHLVTRSLTRGTALTVPVEAEHLFILPWMGKSLLATTDTKFDEDPDAASVTEADIQLLLDKTNAVLPEAKLTREDVIYAYVGLRPLVTDIADTAQTTYGLSRGSEIYDHSAHGGPEGLLSALGGKWTTSRRLAEKIVDTAFAKLGRAPNRKRSADTVLACAPREDLGDFMDAMRAQYPKIDTAHIDLLSRLYGALLPQMMASNPKGLEKLKDPILAARVSFAVAQEMAMHLSDVVLRRLVEGQTGELTAAQIEVIGAYMAKKLGWSEAELETQKADLAALMTLSKNQKPAKKGKPKAKSKSPSKEKSKAPSKAKSKTQSKEKSK